MKVLYHKVPLLVMQTVTVKSIPSLEMFPDLSNVNVFIPVSHVPRLRIVSNQQEMN